MNLPEPEYLTGNVVLDIVLLIIVIAGLLFLWKKLSDAGFCVPY